MDETVPNFSLDLVQYLERIFPDRCPSLGVTTDAVWFAAGQASVARKLRFEFDRAVERALAGR